MLGVQVFRSESTAVFCMLICRASGLWGKYDDRSSAFLRGILTVTFRLAETPADWQPGTFQCCWSCQPKLAKRARGLCQLHVFFVQMLLFHTSSLKKKKKRKKRKQIRYEVTRTQKLRFLLSRFQSCRRLSLQHRSAFCWVNNTDGTITRSLQVQVKITCVFRPACVFPLVPL